MDQIDLSRISAFFAADGEGIYKTAYQTVKQNSMDNLIASGVLLGLSGGADSVMLLCFLLEYRRHENADFAIVATHLNHMIRGEEADRDEEFCLKLCKSLGVELIVEKSDVPAYAKEKGLGLEEAARNIRYSLFKDIISGRNNINCIAVAHNMSDQAETVLFNIMRGSGARGASGIRPVRDNIVRPLIKISKADILFSLDAFGIEYVSDSTNFCNDYTRNYIRNEIIPAFNRICDNPDKMLSRFADNLRLDDNYLDSVAEDYLNNNSVVTSKSLLQLDYAIFVRVITRMAKNASVEVSSSIISDVYSNLNKDSFAYSLIGGRFICERGVCRVSNGEEPGADFLTYVDLGESCIEALGVDVIISKENIKKTYSNVYKFSIQANLSSAIIKGRLYFRPKKDGDSLFYGGMTHKLKKLFSDRKFSLSDKNSFPVLCDDSGVLWAPGFGVRDDGVPKEQRSDLFILLGSMQDYRFLK